MRFYLVLLAIAAVLIISLWMQGCVKSIGRRSVSLASQNTHAKTDYVREPAVAGQFYEGNPEKLKKIIEEYLEKADAPPLPGTLIGFMEPHAGYVYSGPIAAYGYKHLLGREYKTVFVLAPSHRARFNGLSVIPEGSYRTPLGDVPIDSEAARGLAQASPGNVGFYRQAEEVEHSLEVQVPFLQVALKPGWKIVPILYGQNDLRTCTAAAEAIAAVFDPENHLIIASSDMSHYYPYETARKMDLPTLELVEKLSLEDLSKKLGSGGSEMCGSGPVVTLMMLTKVLGGEAKILKYANSGDTAGDKGQVVGYGCVAFFTTKKIVPKPKAANPDKVDFAVTGEEQKMLISMARKTLDGFIRSKKMPELDENSPLLDKELGLFVTLRKNPGEMLRGCIGHCFPVKKLREALPELTVSSATQDPRFPPVKESELKDITIEISLLSPMRQIKDWNEIRIPGHGVYVKRGYQAGVFLPQVADETGWNRETFMAHLCRDKAGLPPNAWKDPSTELYVFTVIKFEEPPHSHLKSGQN
jgi:hypothetical protein